MRSWLHSVSLATAEQPLHMPQALSVRYHDTSKPAIKQVSFPPTYPKSALCETPLNQFRAVLGYRKNAFPFATSTSSGATNGEKFPVD